MFDRVVIEDRRFFVVHWTRTIVHENQLIDRRKDLENSLWLSRLDIYLNEYIDP